MQLWEQSQIDNSRLRDELTRTRDELGAAKKKMDTMAQVFSVLNFSALGIFLKSALESHTFLSLLSLQAPPSSSGITDTEKKEKIALEKKLSEMEEELKVRNFFLSSFLQIFANIEVGKATIRARGSGLRIELQ